MSRFCLITQFHLYNLTSCYSYLNLEHNKMIILWLKLVWVSAKYSFVPKVLVLVLVLPDAWVKELGLGE